MNYISNIKKITSIIALSLSLFTSGTAHAIVVLATPVQLINTAGFTSVTGEITTTNGLLATTNTNILATNTLLESIYVALIGTDVNANLHADLKSIDGTIKDASMANGNAIKALTDTIVFYKKQEQLAVEEVQKHPSAKQANCASFSSALTATGVAQENNVTIKTQKTAVGHYMKARRKTMRDPTVDKIIAVKEHETKFCSESDAQAGLCLAASVCLDGDVTCKANADQDASLFMVKGYTNQAHQEGAAKFITNITNPYPSSKPKASTIKNMASADGYKYSMIVEESRSSVAESVLKDLWGDRINIIKDPVIQEYINNIDEMDTLTQIAVGQYTNIPYSDPKMKPWYDIFSQYDLLAWMPSAITATPVNGRMSRNEFYDLQVNSMYGNTAFMARLGHGDGRAFQALGQAMALNNKLTLELGKKLDRLVFLQATQSISSGSSADGEAQALERR